MSVLQTIANLYLLCKGELHLQQSAAEWASVGQTPAAQSHVESEKNSAWREVAVVVVVVVIQGCDRRNRRQRDSLWLRIHTHASLMCDQAGRQRRSVEHVQSCFLLHREAFLRLLLHFIALSHLQRTKQTYNIRVPTLRRERALFMRVCIDVHCLLHAEE